MHNAAIVSLHSTVAAVREMHGDEMDAAGPGGGPAA
jgi:hypothetical protein